MKQGKITRRKFFAAIGAAGVGTAAYMRWCEPHWFQVGRHHVKIDPGLPPVRILQMSDLHASPDVSLTQIQEAIELAVSLKPDLVCLTGDFITWKYDYFDEFGGC